jgi:uncharacterized membrane protein YgcG
LPGAGQVGFTGSAAAHEIVDVDYFYDELDPYGEWVWHPQYEYVWLPGNVREGWRPYTVGEWVYTEDQGWFWDSEEPFAWAVYHYGRWGYDPDYGWFWVPGDTWAPAWVQWRYGDDYVGWAPIGPHGSGYAYGAPVNYDPPVVEAWVFVEPRYLTSPTIFDYALSISRLSIAFAGATNIYRPRYRSGVVFNFGIPRQRVVKVVKRPIVVRKVVRVTNKTVVRGRRGKGGIEVFAPSVKKKAKPKKAPKRFVANPKQAKRKAKLKSTFKGKAPKSAGVSAAKITPVAKRVGPQGVKPKTFGRGGGKDKDKGKKATKGEDKSKKIPGGIKGKSAKSDATAAPPPSGPSTGAAPGVGGGKKDKKAGSGKGKGKKGPGGGKGKSAKSNATAAPPPGGPSTAATPGVGGAQKGKKSKKAGGGKGKGGKKKSKSQAKASGGGQAKASGGGGNSGGGKNKKKKTDKCKKNPNHPSCS